MASPIADVAAFFFRRRMLTRGQPMVAPTPMPALAPVLRPDSGGAESGCWGRLDNEPAVGVVQGEPGTGCRG
jgi:hypothetical protein